MLCLSNIYSTIKLIEPVYYNRCIKVKICLYTSDMCMVLPCQPGLDIIVHNNTTAIRQATKIWKWLGFIRETFTKQLNSATFQ